MLLIATKRNVLCVRSHSLRHIKFVLSRKPKMAVDESGKHVHPPQSTLRRTRFMMVCGLLVLTVVCFGISVDSSQRSITQSSGKTTKLLPTTTSNSTTQPNPQATSPEPPLTGQSQSRDRYQGGTLQRVSDTLQHWASKGTLQRFNSSLSTFELPFALRHDGFLGEIVRSAYQRQLSVPDGMWWGSATSQTSSESNRNAILLTMTSDERMALRMPSATVRLPLIDLLLLDSSLLPGRLEFYKPFLNSVLMPTLLFAELNSREMDGLSETPSSDRSFQWLYDGYDANTNYHEMMHSDSAQTQMTSHQHYNKLAKLFSSEQFSGDLLLGKGGFRLDGALADRVAASRKYFDHWDRVTLPLSSSDGSNGVDPLKVQNEQSPNVAATGASMGSHQIAPEPEHILSIGMCVRDWLAHMLRDMVQGNTLVAPSNASLSSPSGIKEEIESKLPWKHRYKHSVPRAKVGELRTWSSLMRALYQSGCTIRLGTASSGALPPKSEFPVSDWERSPSVPRLPFITNNKRANVCGFLPHYGYKVRREPLYASRPGSSAQQQQQGSNAPQPPISGGGSANSQTKILFTNVQLIEDLIGSSTVRQAARGKDTPPQPPSQTFNADNVTAPAPTMAIDPRLACGLQASSSAFVAGWTSAFIPKSKILTLFDHTGEFSAGNPQRRRGGWGFDHYSTVTSQPLPLGMEATCNLFPPPSANPKRNNPTTPKMGRLGGSKFKEGDPFAYDASNFRLKERILFGNDDNHQEQNSTEQQPMRLLLPTRKEWFLLLWGKMKQSLSPAQDDTLVILNSFVPVVSTCIHMCSRGLGTLNIRGLRKEAFDFLVARAVGVVAMKAPPSGTTSLEAVVCGTAVIAKKSNIGPDIQNSPLVMTYKHTIESSSGPVRALLELVRQKGPATNASSKEGRAYFTARARLVGEILQGGASSSPSTSPETPTNQKPGRRPTLLTLALRLLQDQGFDFSRPHSDQPHPPDTVRALEHLFQTRNHTQLFPIPPPQPPKVPQASHSLLPYRFSPAGFTRHIRSLFGINDQCRVINDAAPVLRLVIPDIATREIIRIAGSQIVANATFANTINREGSSSGRADARAATIVGEPDVVPAHVLSEVTDRMLVHNKWAGCD